MTPQPGALNEGLQSAAPGDPGRAGDLRLRGRRQLPVRPDDRRQRLRDRRHRRSRDRAGVRRAGTVAPARSVAAAAAVLAVATVQGDRHLRPPARRRLDAVPAAGPLPPPGHPRATWSCRSPGTRSTPPAPCCPTRTPTSRRRWFPIAPLPFAVGTMVMLIAAVVSLFVIDWALALVGLAIFPRPVRCSTSGTRGGCRPRISHAQQLRAERQRGRPRELRRRAGGQDDGPRGARDRAVRRPGHRAARRDDPGRPGARHVRPAAGRAAQPRHAGRAGGRRRAGCSAGAVNVADVVSVAFLFSVLAVPVRAIGWVLAELPRGVVGWRPGQQRADRDRRDAVRHRPTVAGSGAGRRCGSTDVSFALRRGAAGAARRHASRCRPARRWRWSARPAPASRRSPRWPRAWSTRPPARSRSTASTCRDLTAAALAGDRRAGAAGAVRLRRHRSPATSRWTATRVDDGAGRRRCGVAQADVLRQPRSPTGSTPWSASAAPRSPAGSASG